MDYIEGQVPPDVMPIRSVTLVRDAPPSASANCRSQRSRYWPSFIRSQR
ncbi:phosphotransferase enzyme family domain protein [Mycobacterium xenopi 4042]|uniref:Phosphotransferase enzyme family domain protein n=1 Tax=Mycobacterium xenopi 4042 TaxID=1299334 RepID=X7YLK8_MYCXE|nr:phosphotransferase enzyme family domain protein [Mycobacterium xenopi 4042]